MTNLKQPNKKVIGNKYPKPKAFRFTDSDIDALHKLTDEVISKTDAKIKHTQVLRALIHLGNKIAPKAIINKIKDLSV